MKRIALSMACTSLNNGARVRIRVGMKGYECRSRLSASEGPIFNPRALPNTQKSVPINRTVNVSIARLKRDGTRVETRFRLSAKGTSPFKSAGASVQLTACSGGVRISGSNAGYTTFRGSVRGTGLLTYSMEQSPS